ncbi:dna-directed rna polymerase iii subunit 2 [Quercus suber]|uniref:DNA-directed RNA polymerase n=1 Tax=Quercus suber TaxID=58331 RepID=A0AAW0LEH6_QUESU
MGEKKDSLEDPTKQNQHVGKQLPDNPDIDMQFLSAPIKSAVDKYQLVPEFLKVRGLVKQHLDSFNYFVNIGIKKIVRANDRIESSLDPSVYVRFKNVRIGKPSVPSDGVDDEICPQFCRLSDMTYALLALHMHIIYVFDFIAKVLHLKDILILYFVFGFTIGEFASWHPKLMT